MDPSITLWGAGTSRTLRPIWVAEELGLRYVLKPIGPRTGETQSAEYTALNPKQKIPLLVDGSICVTESLAICRYLIEAYPGDTIARPVSLAERTREDEWCCYLYGELDETSLYVMRRHGDLGHIYGSAPAVVTAAGEYATRHLGVVARLLDGREYVTELGFGLADVVLMTCLDWALAHGLELPAELEDYRARIAERDAYRRAMKINFPGGPPVRSR